MNITIIGAGVAGLVCAVELQKRNANITIIEKGAKLGDGACSFLAGGMLAPWCEAVEADARVVELGQQALHWWEKQNIPVTHKGTLVIAPTRDQAELTHFANRTTNHTWLTRDEINTLEPDLEKRFNKGLFFKDEAHLNPREALKTLEKQIINNGGEINYNTSLNPFDNHDADLVIDCRGFSARKELPQLRGVKGEMLYIKTPDITLNRTIRLLHPRYPLYIVPRGEGVFMIGATQIESEDRKRITTRSMLELLTAAYALHPAFGEAEILEIGVDVRPAFADNLPRIYKNANRIHVNGLYRHGFLLAPALAKMVTGVIYEKAVFPALMPELEECR